MNPVEYREAVDYAACTPQAVNSNVMSEADFASLIEVVRTYGVVQPPLLSLHEGGELRIEDGHHRIRAARAAGLPTGPAMVYDASSPQAMHLLRLALNRLRGQADLALVAQELAELHSAGLDIPALALSGYSELELQQLIEAAQPPAAIEDMEVLRTEEGEPQQALGPEKVFELTLAFRTRGELARARKVLRKAGRAAGGDMADGLLRLCGLEESDGGR